MAATDDEDSVETISAESADPALGVSVRVGRLDGRADHRDCLSPEDLVEGVAELRVAIMDEKPKWLLVAELVGCSYSVSCCDCFVFVDESAQQVVAM